MGRWRRRITVVLAFGALLWIAGCGGAAEDAAPPAPVSSAELQPEQEPAPKAGPARKPRNQTAPDLRPDAPSPSLLPAAAAADVVDGAAGTEALPGAEQKPSSTAERSSPRNASTSGARSGGSDADPIRSRAGSSDRREATNSSARKKSAGGSGSGTPVVALGGVSPYGQQTAAGSPGVDPASGSERPKSSGGGAAPPPAPSDGDDFKKNPEPDLPQQTAQVVLQPNMLDVAPGSVLTFHIWIYGGQDVASVPFHLQFNPEVLEFQGAHEGPFLSGDGESTVFMFAGGAGGQSVIVGHSRLTRETGANGTGELCVLNFVAKAEGNPGLAFDRASVIGISGKPQPSLFEIQPLVIR